MSNRTPEELKIITATLYGRCPKCWSDDTELTQYPNYHIRCWHEDCNWDTINKTNPPTTDRMLDDIEEAGYRDYRVNIWQNGTCRFTFTAKIQTIIQDSFAKQAPTRYLALFKCWCHVRGIEYKEKRL